MRCFALIFFLIASLRSINSLEAQPKPVLLHNPSFEDSPRHSRPPSGWYFCGPVTESPPDVHPSGMFGVQKVAYDGKTYLGMVVRDNGSWEAIAQRLSQPLQAGQCYRFGFLAARSDNYISISRATMTRANFTTPAIVRIWGTNDHCEGRELLAQTGPIDHHDWKLIPLFLIPKSNYSHLIMEAYYQRESNQAYYNGNVLIDHCSPLLPVSCDDQSPLVPPDRLSPLHLKAAEELPEVLSEQGKMLKFSLSGVHLESHLFLDHSEVPRQANRYLWQMARALTQFPEQKLLIVLKSASDLEQTEAALALKYTLTAAGLSPNQYKIRGWKRSDRKRAWLWPPEDQKIYMKLEN